MKKLLGLALVPAVLASLPAFANEPVKHDVHHPMTKTQMMAPAHQAPIDRQVLEQYSDAQWQLVEKRYPEAVERFERILKTEPNYVPAIQGLSISLFQQGYYEKALVQIDRALALDPVNTKLFFTKGQILDRLDREDKALEAYLTFTALDPMDTASLDAQRRADELFTKWEGRLSQADRKYFEGLRFLSMERPEKALPMLKEFSEMQPNNINAKLLLGVAYDRIGQPINAVPVFEAVTKAEPTNSHAYFQLGNSYEQLGKTQNAKQAWKKFVEVAPHSEAAETINRRIAL